MTVASEPVLITVEEAARLLRIGRGTAYRSPPAATFRL